MSFIERIRARSLSPEILWQGRNLKDRLEGIDRKNSLVFDFTGEELPAETKIKKFPDSEFLVQILKNKVSGQKAAYFLSPVLNENQAFLLSHYADALRQLGIKEITLVCPFLGYTRGDKPAPEDLDYVESRGLTAIAQALRFIDRLIVVEPHSPETLRCFCRLKIPTLTLSPWKFLINRLSLGDKENLLVVGPDKGRGSVAVDIARYLGVNLVSLDKQRNPLTGEVTIGDLTFKQKELLKGKRVVIYDDVITTGGTLVKIAACLGGAEISGIIVLTAHDISCGNAVQNLAHHLIKEIYSTDTRRPVSDLTPIKEKVKIVPIRPFLEEVIRADMQNPNFNPWKDPRFSGIICR